jgi:hypothetical protein
MTNAPQDVVSTSRDRPAESAPLNEGPTTVFEVTKGQIVDAVLAALDDFIDPPMMTGLTVTPDDRLAIARRVAARVDCHPFRKDRST